jgi:hypothetical protein
MMSSQRIASIHALMCRDNITRKADALQELLGSADGTQRRLKKAKVHAPQAI